MSIIELYSSPYITVNFRPDKKIVHHTIHQPVGEAHIESHKEALHAGTEALRQYGASKWLSDDRNNGPLPEEILEWSKGWYPVAVEAGWRYWANVVPAEVIAAGTLTAVLRELHSYGLEMQVFASVDEAEEWLDSRE